MNPFSGRLDIPLPCRLVNEGFPCVRLIEQRRMVGSAKLEDHEVLSLTTTASLYLQLSEPTLL